MYGFNCQECKTLIPLIDKEGEQVYFRLTVTEEFYCKKCSKNVKLNDADKIVREGKNFVTVVRSDY